MEDDAKNDVVESVGSTVVQGMKVWGQVDYVGADVSRWIVVYPHYIDSTRKQVEGRRIAKDKAVEKPTAAEVFECVRKLALRTQLEMDKSYCRDCWIRGRVRVELFDSTGNPVNAGLKTRQALLVRIASLIPAFRLHNSVARGGGAVKSAPSGSKINSGGAKGAGGTTKVPPAAVPAKKKKGKR